MHTFLNRKLTIFVCLAFGGLDTGRAQVQPLPIIPPDALVQTYTGRLAHTLLNGYVKNDDARLSDSRTPTGTAGGDLTGTYPNPTIKASVNLSGNPTVTGNLTVNGTGENLIKGNLRLKGNSNYGNKLNFGDGDYVYLHEVTDDNLTVKAKNIELAPTTAVTAPTPATTDNSTKIATTAYVKNNLSQKLTGHFACITNSSSHSLFIAAGTLRRGGTKENDEPAFICRLVDNNLVWSSAALIGNTYESVKLINTTSYAGNYIYQTADGKYINIINKTGCVGTYSYVIFKNGNEDIYVREAIWLPCSIDDFISHINEFSF